MVPVQCSCRALFPRMVRGAEEEVHESLLLLRKVSHGLASLLVEGRDARVKLNKVFRSQQENLGCFSLW